jgi:hypothetical protein
MLKISSKAKLRTDYNLNSINLKFSFSEFLICLALNKGKKILLRKLNDSVI